MDAVVAALLIVGLVLTIGGGVFGRWIAPPELASVRRRATTAVIVAGALLVVAASLGDAAVTLLGLTRGGWDPSTYGDYLVGTRHGRASLARAVLAGPLAAWALMLRGRAVRSRHDTVFVLLAITTLATVSLVSHSGAMGPLGAVADLGHLLGTTAWVGAVTYLAWLPVWDRGAPLVVAVRRVGLLGLASVAVLMGTGLYMATLHLYGLRALSDTSYGLALVAKLSLVVLVLGIAGANRFVLVPLLERRGVSRPLRTAVRLESVLLLGVLVATGVLTTREPAHGPDHPPGPGHDVAGAADAGAHHAAPPAAARRVNRFATGIGTLVVEGDVEGHLLLRLETAADVRLSLEAIAPDGSFVPVEATVGDTTLPAEALRVPRGETFRVWLPDAPDGRWLLLAELEGAGRRELVEVDLTRIRARARTGVDVALVLVPTPSLEGRGLTEAFVGASIGGLPMHPPVHVRMAMPGMTHDGDEGRTEFTMDHERDLAAHHASLAFPMAGTWRLELGVGLSTLAVDVEVVE